MAEAQTWRQRDGAYFLGVVAEGGASFKTYWRFRTKARLNEKIQKLFDEGEVDQLSRWTKDGVWKGTEARFKFDAP